MFNILFIHAFVNQTWSMLFSLHAPSCRHLLLLSLTLLPLYATCCFFLRSSLFSESYLLVLFFFFEAYLLVLFPLPFSPSFVPPISWYDFFFEGGSGAFLDAESTCRGCDCGRSKRFRHRLCSWRRWCSQPRFDGFELGFRGEGASSSLLVYYLEFWSYELERFVLLCHFLWPVHHWFVRSVVLKVAFPV